MRASGAVGLLLVSSVSIFGIVTSHSPDSNSGTLSDVEQAVEPTVEPVWVGGVMGVYDPDTGQFVPSTSPLFDATCEKIRRRRDQANGNYWSNSYYNGHHWYYTPGSTHYSYTGGGPSQPPGAYSGSSSGSSSFSHSSSGSERGGIGSTGHSFGGGHGGGE